jgi:hypothetical protein
MTKIDLVKSRKDIIEFTSIPVPESADIERLEDMLNGAETALFMCKKMLEGIKAADEVTDFLQYGWEYDYMMEENEIEDYEESAVDVTNTLKKHLIKQVARLTQHCDDLQACIDDVEEYDRNAAQYGTYSDQVSKLFYKTR